MNVPCGTPLTAPHVTTGRLCRWKAISKEGRHVGLDFYDLLIEGHYAHNRRSVRSHFKLHHYPILHQFDIADPPA